MGAHPKEVQARLGHSSIRVTLDWYGHLFPVLDEQLADRLHELAATSEADPRADRMRTNGGKEVTRIETMR